MTSIIRIELQFLHPYKGVQVKILHLQDQVGETSDIIVDYLHQVLKHDNFTEQVLAFYGDTDNVKFGSEARN